MYKKFIKLAIVFSLVLTVTIQCAPKKAEALFGVADYTFTTQVGDVSPSGISNWANIVAGYMKDYVLDRLAVIIARQILHRITVQTIDWINSGYDGSPAFLTNPGDFFADVADHVTGDFISGSGPLSQLCSPFNIDIRLNLALSQGQSYDERYSCTLSDIISRTSVNGASIEGFIEGDFSQGGWPAFISMTTETQNNPASALLQAQSDLRARVGNRRAAVALDLQIGSGFLSYDTCTDVTSQINGGGIGAGSGALEDGQAEQLNERGDQSIVTGQDRFGNNSTIQKKVGKDGTVAYKSCQTQTPGSVVASKLFKNSNTTETQLELVKSINDIINAAITQLTSSLLEKGLNALSKSGSGSRPGRSYTQDALQDIMSQSQRDLASGQVAAAGAATGAANQGITTNKASYDQAVSSLVGSKNNLAAAAACFEGKIGQGGVPRIGFDFAGNQAAALRNWSTSRIDPTLAVMVTKQQIAANQAAQTQINGSVQAAPQSLEDLQDQIPGYQNAIQQSIASSAQIDTTTALSDLETAQILAQQGNQYAVEAQSACNVYPGTITPVTAP